MRCPGTDETGLPSPAYAPLASSACNRNVVPKETVMPFLSRPAARRAPSRGPAARPGFRPRLDALEGRLAPAVFTVTNVNDSGAGSLRQAILNSNATPGLDTINFNIPGAVPQTITPTSPLPPLTDPAILDGATQPGYAGAPVVQLSGALAGANNVHGLVVTAGGTRVQGLSVTGFSGDGILLAQLGADVVANNYVGVGPNGTTKAANAFGIVVAGGAANYIAGNVVAANTYYGVTLNNAAGNVAASNYVGTNAAGAAGLGNGVAGVVLNGATTNNSVGGNVIGGNGAFGVLLNDAATKGNIVYANYVGLSAGATPLPNGFAGVGLASGASGNTVGAAAASGRNFISDNAGYSVYLEGAGTSGNVIQSDYIGTTPSGSAGAGNGLAGVDVQDGASGNLVGGDVIASNAQGGVVLQGAGTSGNVVASCLIGTNAAGTAALGNGSFGVLVQAGASGNLVSGDLVSGNLNGVALLGAGTTGNAVQACYVGTNLAGSAALPGAAVGVFVGNGAAGNTVGNTAAGLRNVIAGSSSYGVELTGAGTTGNQVSGNAVGVNAAGTAAVPNGIGVFVVAGASGNTVASNVLAGNSAAGVALSGAGTTGNVVAGNLIGTADGKAALPGLEGVILNGGASNNTVGGTTAAARNVISGNSKVGIDINSAGTAGNVVQGNYIGLAADGASALGNGLHGVLIFASAANNTIGGVAPAGAGAGTGGAGGGTSVTLGGVPAAAAPGVGNVIAFNGGAGVVIGTDTANGYSPTQAGTGNAVLGNSVFGNAKLGIDLGNDDGVTPNDPNDADTGPNNFQNFPALTSATASGNSVLVVGTLQTVSNTTFRVEVFADPPGTTGNGQGLAYLGYVTVTTDGSGNATFAAILADPGASGQVVSATATDPLGNTSEFAADLTVR
jgi:hypothetical protein